MTLEDATFGPVPRTRGVLRRLLPTRYSALATIQLLVTVGAVVYVVWPPPNEETAALSVWLIPFLLVLITFTETLARRLPWWGLEGCLTVTWLLVAVLAATRSNGEGQIFVAFTMMLLTVYALYYLPRRHGAVQVAAMTTTYLVALFIKFGNPGPSLFMLALLAMLVGTALLGTARANDLRERFIIDYAGDVVFHSANGIVQWISPSVQGVLGWDPEDLIGTSIHRLWHAEDYDKALAIRDLAYSGSSGVAVLRFLTRDGEYLWIEITFKPYSEHGEQGAVGTMRDVSDRVAAEQALIASEQDYRQLAQMEAQQRKQIAELDDVKSRLFQNISHELRTPLTLIQAPLLELLHDREEMSRMPPRRQADLQAAAKAAAGLQRLVDGLLDVARGQAGELRISPEPTNLAAVTREAVELFRPRAEQAGLQLIVTAVAFPPMVLIDREAWLKILTNLVSNAVKFTARGQVSVDLRFARGMVELLVSDSGAGIPETELPNIFARFQQAASRPARDDSGSGIGLALVAELVRALGGSVHVDSSWGVGTTFIVRVPAERSDSEPPARSASSPASSPVPAAAIVRGSDSAGSILLVEDHVDLRNYVVRLLESEGWTVTAVPTAEDGLDAVASADLILTDLMLPGEMNGIDLVRWVRSTEAVRPTPVIVLTARTGVETLTDALAAGADALITKPFDPEALVSRVAAQLELVRLRDDRSGSVSELCVALQRDRINATAIGILMVSEGLGPDSAFTRLSELSARNSQSLEEAAREVVLNGRTAPAH